MNTTVKKLSWIEKNSLGLFVCFVLGLISWLVAEFEKSIFDRAVIDALVIAIVLGVVVKNVLPLPLGVATGSTFASKQILETSVLLLGAGVALQDISAVGLPLFLLILFSVFGGLLFAWILGHKILHLSSRLSVLVGVGNSICGNSAVAAVAPVIKATPNEVAAAIGISAILGVGQILILPFFVPVLSLSNVQYGIVAGLSVYAVPQVIAASFAVSAVSGEMGTLVKLVRVLFLGPMIVILGFFHRESNDSKDLVSKIKTYVPWFVAGFIILMLLRSVDVIPESVGTQAQKVSKLLFILAMAGLGLGVDIKAVRTVGIRVAATILGTMCFMIIVALIGSTVLELR